MKYILLFFLINIKYIFAVIDDIDDIDDTIVVEAEILPNIRDERAIPWAENSKPSGFCLTSKGEKGNCTTFKQCYPYFKTPDLSDLDGWVLGFSSTCSYTGNNGLAFGICCPSVSSSSSKPIEDPVIIVEEPQEPEESNKKEIIGISQQAVGPGSWPPPLPTHSPDNTIPPLPTHAPFSTKPPTFITSKPITIISTTTKKTTSPTTTSTTKRPISTTWPTKKPGWWPGATTPKPVYTSTTTSSLSSSIDISECGAKNGDQDQERIVGGQNADPGEWPWIAALFNAGRQVCGGSLIDNVHILTAAHCVAHMNSWDVARLTVRLGDYNIKTNNEVVHIEKRVRRVVRHKGFDVRTLYNDVAVLTLSEPVQFTERVRPICLPAGSQLYHGKVATVIGWGSLRESGPQPAILQEVAIPVWTNSECKEKYGTAAPGGIVDSFLCAGRAAKDSCSGDSGGPLMVNDGRWTQVGIVSWGIGCGKGQYPGVYTRVTHFIPWISKNLR